MAKSIFSRHRVLLSLAGLLLLTNLQGQNIKLQIKPFIGGHVGLFREKLETAEKELTYGYQGGFAFRIIKDKAFLEPGFLFLKDYFQLSDTLETVLNELGLEDPAIRYNTFEFPIIVGYRFVDTELFKWFVAGGLAMNVSIKSNIFDGKEKVAKFKASELGLSNPRFTMRMGTGFDLAFFTLGMYYNLGLNSVSKSVYRTQSHSFEFNMGILF